MITPGTRRILGITGAPGSGKTTLAEALTSALGSANAALVSMDGFHLSSQLLARLGRIDRKGAHDTFDDAGYEALIRRLARHQSDEVVYAPKFSRELEESIGSAIAINRDVPLVITEGNYLLLERGAWPQARRHMDEVWFIEPDENTRMHRLIARHERYGRSIDEARRRATGSDQVNADLIKSTKAGADSVFRITGDIDNTQLNCVVDP